MKKYTIILFLLTLTFQACVKDKPEPHDNPSPSGGGRRLYIANEGSLGNGNSSLSFYNIDKDSIFNDVFYQKNARQLGDIFQSMLIDGDQLYMAINNSDKIVVVNKQDFVLKASITVRKP